MKEMREKPLVTGETALLFIDVQNYSAHREGGSFAGMENDEKEKRYGWFFRELEGCVLPNMKALLDACRGAGVEVIYTAIESLTRDGRDNSLDYKISGLHVPRGSWDGKVLDAIVPGEDEIVLPKTSCSVFISTNLDYILRNLGVKQLVLSGLLTDQCIESAIRDGADLGYLVTQATDACLTHSAERQENSLRAIAGYCRQRTTAELLEELRSNP